MTLRSPAALAAWADTIVTEPVIVIGSPPDTARDLDLLCRETAVRQLTDALEAAGFVEQSGTWARFDDCGAEVIDVLAATEGAVPAAVLDRLFDNAQPLPGCSHVRLPAPHHQLLLLARRTAGERGPLTPGRRERLERLTSVSDLWERASAEAADWSARHALEQLRARSGGQLPGRIARARARLERSAATQPARGRWRLLLPRRDTAPVIAFCGLDGSGKSTQAQALAETLELLGYTTAQRWSRLTYDRSVERVAAPAKRLLALTAILRRRRSGRPSADAPAGGASAASSAQRGALATVWTLTLVALHSLEHRRTRRAARGCVVIWDRYVVDAVVQLRTDYAARTDTSRPERLLRRLSPTPIVTFFLDVPAEVAGSRKDDFSVEELARHRQGYLDVVADGDVVRLDGTLPQAELCRDIIRATMDALAATGR